MNDPSIRDHNGIRFTVEAVRQGDVYVGRFTILDASGAAGSATDTYRPTMDNAWATETEALTYATEAAHHAIEGILPFTMQQR